MMRSPIYIKGKEVPKVVDVEVETLDAIKAMRVSLLLRFNVPDDASIELIEGLPTWVFGGRDPHDGGAPVQIWDNDPGKVVAGRINGAHVYTGYTTPGHTRFTRYATPYEMQLLNAVDLLVEHFDRFHDGEALPRTYD